MKTIEELIEEKAEKMGGLTGHQREVYRKYLEQGDRENVDREDNHNEPVEGYYEERRLED